MEPNSFFTWQALMSYSGATLATTLVTQFLKSIPLLEKVRTRLLSYVIAILIMALATIFTQGFSWSGFAMTFVNAVVVALASNGAFDAISSDGKKTKQTE